MHIWHGISGTIRNLWLATRKGHQELFSRIIFVVKKIKKMQSIG